MSTKVVLAIDLGTTGNRVIAFDNSGSIVAHSYYEFRQIFPEPGYVEHDPLEILATTKRALSDVLSQVGAENVASIGITNQRETSILWNRRTGRPVHNAIVWQDRRTDALCRELQESAKKVKETTGLFIDPYFSATKIRWMLDNVSGLREAVERGEILFGTPETWILWNLTGGRVHATEPGNASRTLLFDIHNLRFDADMLSLFGVPASILPEVHDSDAHFGETDPAITSRAIPITGLLGDQQAALFAQCGREAGPVKATYGTGIFILTNTLARAASSRSLVTTIGWKFRGEVNYALEGSLFMGGASVQWLRDNLKMIEKASDTESLAASSRDNEGVYFVPALQGLGAPYWDPTARGLLIGITRKTTRETIARAVLESLAYQVRDIIEEMENGSGMKVNVLRVDGGATTNDFLMDFQASLLHTPVERSSIAEITGLGAAGIAGISSGFWSEEEFRRARKPEHTFQPAGEAREGDPFEAFYAKWKEAVKRSMGWA